MCLLIDIPSMRLHFKSLSDVSDGGFVHLLRATAEWLGC